MSYDDVDNPESEDEEEELLFFPDVVEIISLFGCSEKVAAAIANQKKYNYMQAFQMLCSMGGIDAMLLFAIGAVETQGYPECPNRLGMFQMTGNPHESNAKAQISYAVQKLKEKEEIFGKNNILEIVTSLKFNDPKLDEYLLDPTNRPEVMVPRKEKSTDDSGQTTTTIVMVPYVWSDKLEYGEEYCLLLDALGYDLNSMAYYGKVCMCYDVAKSSITGSSALDQNDNTYNYSFPFASESLLDLYFISDYGIESTSFGAAKVKPQVLFKCKVGSPIHSPCRCTAVNIQKTSAGFTVSIPLDSNNGTLYYLMVDKIASASNYFEALSKNQILGYSGEHFAIAYKDRAGNIQDPKLIFNQLNGKLNKEESIGDQLVNSTVVRTNGDNYTIG